jgi:hypothetical protein
MTAAPVDGSVDTPPFHERLPVIPRPPAESSLPGAGSVIPSGLGYGTNEGDTAAAGRTPALGADDDAPSDVAPSDDAAGDDAVVVDAPADWLGAVVTSSAVAPDVSAARARGPRTLWTVVR